MTESLPAANGQQGVGEINIRLTHPALYWLVMFVAVVCIAQGMNFIFLQPTFPIYERSNNLWGVIFLVLGPSKIIFLNFYRRMHLVRLTMYFSVCYMLYLGFGTTQPLFEGKGSLQLPIMYAGMAALQVPFLVEPFINPLTARWKR